ncbi:hypothetical protein FOMG_17682 [Fusarium oxysporum f. sp. melonis 26406]|uniref:Uncharacterized protein n=2 Tax=Fusarium oxysporum TaxID=5507 RepID=W9Z2Q1_FUSOX|nr:hypothetical protein FOVG_10143 [Fusarium oxysporum f. sp. pisi HDV247]EXK25675.1 hypothetical protein FOMG_17682 [Fusarium oxysporum f. sp. melonis 26406]
MTTEAQPKQGRTPNVREINLHRPASLASPAASSKSSDQFQVKYIVRIETQTNTIAIPPNVAYVSILPRLPFILVTAKTGTEPQIIKTRSIVSRIRYPKTSLASFSSPDSIRASQSWF